jgi:O-antigen/teichoic acid export membrane protein
MMFNQIKQLFMRQTVRRVFSYSTAVVVTQILMMVYTILLIRWLPSDKFGIIAANYAMVTMMAFVINWGFNEWLVKAVATSDNPAMLTGSVIRFKLMVGFFWAIILWVGLPYIQPGIYQPGLLLIIILDVWLDTTFNLFIADLLGREKVSLSSILLVASRVMRLLSLITIIMIGSRSILLISSLRLACTLFVFITAWIVVNPSLSLLRGDSIPKVFRRAVAFNFYEVLNLIYTQIDINLLTWLSGDASLIGNYAFVTSLINMVMTVPSGIYNLLLPSTINTYRASRPGFISRMRQILGGFIFLGILVWAGGALLGMDWVVDLFGSGYQEGILLLAMISPVLFLRTVNQFNNLYLVTVGMELKRLLPQIISVVTKVLFGVWVVLQWQAIGLVKLSIVVDAILLAGFSVLVMRHHSLANKVDPE